MTDIIEGARAGSATALNGIYETYKKQIYYFCLKLVDDVELAGDLCCETFSCAYERLDTLEDPSQFEIWIKNIAAIRCYNYIHKMKPMLFLQAVGDTAEPLLGEQEIATVPKGDVDELKTAALIDEMLDRLNDAQRMTLMLHYYNDLSVGQIAKIMSCDVSIVKQRMSKAAEHIKNTIAALKNAGTKLTPVDFRNALQITAACTAVPQLVENKANAIISAFTQEEVEQPIPHEEEMSDSEYILEHYINSDHTAGVMEEAVTKFTDVPEIPKFDENRFAAFAPKTETAEITEKPQDVGNSESPSGSAKKSAALPSLFTDGKTKNTVRYGIAALVIVLVFTVVVVCLPKGSPEKSETKPESTASSASAVVSKQEPVKTALKAQISYSEKQDNLKSTDGATIAKVSYRLPTVTGIDAAAAEKINAVFAQECETVLNSYTSDEKKAECEYAYSEQPYGEFSAYLNNVTAQSGKTDEKTVNIKTTAETFLYGNVHGDSESTGYCFSATTGEMLSASAVFAANFDEYVSTATANIAGQALDGQTAGGYTLLENYESLIRENITLSGNWYFTDDGVEYIFNDEEITYYGSGTLTFTVPYDVIADYISADYK